VWGSNVTRSRDVVEVIATPGGFHPPDQRSVL
jgi:hypothetical protein